MPNPGGESDKLGNQYEGVWTIGRLLDMAASKVESLIVEPISGDNTGIEFVLKDNAGVLEFHSAKRQRAKGEWSLAAITTKDKKTSRSVLGDLFVKLANHETARVYFVSSTGANDLRELAERARLRKTLPDFEAELNTKSRGRSGSSALRQSFEKHVLPMAPDLQAAHDYLKRTTVALIDHATLTRLVDQHIVFLVYRPDGRVFLPAEVRVLLGDFVLASLGTEIRADAVWEYLNGFGYFKRDWAVDAAVRDVVRKGNLAYVRAVETDLANGMRIPRDESQRLIDELNRSDGAKSFLISAAAGVGKSCVLAQAVEALDNNHVPALIVRLDRHGDARSSKDIGSQMDLPQSPVVVLAGISHGGKCVLVLDQLDAVSQLSGRYPHLWETFDALCREVEAYPNMRLVIACRDFDLQHDHRLRRLKHSETVRPIPVQPLSVAAVDSILTKAGVDPSKISPRQKQILQTPLHLFLFLDGPPEDRAESGFQNIGDLFERYWQHKQSAVANRLGHESDWIQVIDRICDSMSQSQTLTAPQSTVDEWSATAAAMQTEHVLLLDGTQLRFFHESFFDYAFARRLCATGPTLLVMLLSSEQGRLVPPILTRAQSNKYAISDASAVAYGKRQVKIRRTRCDRRSWHTKTGDSSAILDYDHHFHNGLDECLRIRLPSHVILKQRPSDRRSGGKRGQQLFQSSVFHRLDQVVVESGVFRRLPVVLLAPSGHGHQQHAFAPRLLSYPTGHVVAV